MDFSSFLYTFPIDKEQKIEKYKGQLHFLKQETLEGFCDFVHEKPMEEYKNPEKLATRAVINPINKGYGQYQFLHAKAPKCNQNVQKV